MNTKTLWNTYSATEHINFNPDFSNILVYVSMRAKKNGQKYVTHEKICSSNFICIYRTQSPLQLAAVREDRNFSYFRDKRGGGGYCTMGNI